MIFCIFFSLISTLSSNIFTNNLSCNFYGYFLDSFHKFIYRIWICYEKLHLLFTVKLALI